MLRVLAVLKLLSPVFLGLWVYLSRGLRPRGGRSNGGDANKKR